MKDLTCVVVGGGHAGIYAAQAISEESQKHGRRIQVTLIDKQPYHVRKVLLFKPAVEAEDITVPWGRILPDGIRFVQGMVRSVESGEKFLLYVDEAGDECRMDYDMLVVAAGSVVRQPHRDQGGIALTDKEAAVSIRKLWNKNLRIAARETDAQERKRLLTVAVVGASISGIETSAELACQMRQQAEALGMNADAVTVYLVNARERLFQEGPAKVGQKLEQLLAENGVTVLHQRKALQERDGQLFLEDGGTLPVGVCVWTLGLSANPMLSQMGLPLSPAGQVLVDSCYRVSGMEFVYSIGDCAKIVDPSTGKADRMTCKEGIMQAKRLGKIVLADWEGRVAPAHKGVMDSFCIGLGPEQGLVWSRKWGLDFIITGKLAWNLKKYVWDSASLLR